MGAGRAKGEAAGSGGAGARRQLSPALAQSRPANREVVGGQGRRGRGHRCARAHEATACSSAIRPCALAVTSCQQGMFGRAEREKSEAGVKGCSSTTRPCTVATTPCQQKTGWRMHREAKSGGQTGSSVSRRKEREWRELREITNGARVLIGNGALHWFSHALCSGVWLWRQHG